MKKIGVLLGLTLMCAMVLTGCTSSADTLPSPSPSATGAPTNTPMMNGTQEPTVSLSPSATDGMGLTDGMMDGTMDPAGMNGPAGMQTSAGVNTVEDAARVSDRVAEEVEKLSELDDAEAVVAGNIALVGIEYDDQYQGGLTDRLKEMVEERVDLVDKTITTVHVTDDAQKMKDIAALNDRLENNGMTFEELQTEVLEIGSSIAGGSTPQVNQPQTNTGA